MTVVLGEIEAITGMMTETEEKIVIETGTVIEEDDEIGQDQKVGTESADETEVEKEIGVDIEVPHHLDNREENGSLCGTGLHWALST